MKNKALLGGLAGLTILTIVGCGNANNATSQTTPTYSNNRPELNANKTRLTTSTRVNTPSSERPSNVGGNNSQSANSSLNSSGNQPDLQQELSTYPTTVRGAIEWLSVHAHPVVGGPTVLPHTKLKGYPSAVVRTTPSGWLTSVYMTDHPYKTNSQEILAASRTGLSDHLSDWELGPSWTFGVSKLSINGRPTMHSETMDNLLEGLPANKQDTEPWRSWPHHSVDLGHGIIGSLYQRGQYSPTLVWEEGDWTFILPNSLASDEQQVARAMVGYMNVWLLPPYPGVVTVQIGVHGYYANASYMQGDYVYRVSMAGSDETNEAVGVLRMAVHWHSLTI
jgi:hypothetical protein